MLFGGFDGERLGHGEDRIMKDTKWMFRARIPILLGLNMLRHYSGEDQ